MKLNEMNAEEQTALGTLVRVIVALDGEYSMEESNQVLAAAAQLGTDDFWTLIRDTGSQPHSEEIVNAQAAAVTRQEARVAIYSALFNIAAAGSIVSQEGHLLDQLAATWKIETD